MGQKGPFSINRVSCILLRSTQVLNKNTETRTYQEKKYYSSYYSSYEGSDYYSDFGSYDSGSDYGSYDLGSYDYGSDYGSYDYGSDFYSSYYPSYGGSDFYSSYYPSYGGEFRCNDTGTKLPRSWVCDGYKDCYDCSDEVCDHVTSAGTYLDMCRDMEHYETGA